MRTTRTLHALMVVGLAVAGAAPSEAYVLENGALALRTTINFFEAEKFTDLKDRSSPSNAASAALLAELKKHFVQQASRYIPANQKLVVTVTDIDLAGEFEPWNGPSFDDIRIVRDIYRPRIALVFQLTDAEGNVVKTGKRELSDPTFLSRLTLDRNDPLRYEKLMIEAWLRAEFQRPNKG